MRYELENGGCEEFDFVEESEQIMWQKTEKMLKEWRDYLKVLVKDGSFEEVAVACEEANKWISWWVGQRGDKTDEVYDEFRYRMFVTASGKIVVAQGVEVDVDVRREDDLPEQKRSQYGY